MVSCIGSDMGKAAMNVLESVTNQQINSIVIEPGNSALFVYYNLSRRKDEIRTSASGSAQPILNKTAFGKLEILLPPLPEQKAIARILGTLDDKIELNQQMNETLEGLIRALFKSWFVDFNPVRAKANGLGTGLPKKIADLFPDALEHSGKGDIPQGWQLKPIGELATVSGGSTPSTKESSYWEEGTHYWATPKDLSTLKTPVLLETERKITDSGLVQISSGLLPKGTVLMSSRAPIGYLAIAEVPVAINQGFIAMQAAEGVSNQFLLRWAEWAHDLIVSRANGSTFLEISKANFRPILAVTPPESLMNEFDRIARPLYKRIVCNEESSSRLGQIRDALLPKLMLGEIRVRDAESTIERLQ
jgi:type I restriction enzyme S subunit